MRHKISIILFAFYMNFHCINPESPQEDTIVHGVLTFQNQPLSNANVQIDEVLNWKTTTDENGYFEIKYVTEGEHLLKSYKSLDNNMTTSSSSSIVVSAGTNELGNIRLPEPSLLYEIDKTKLNENLVTLKWSRSFDPEFREYKVYRKEDAGIDETTGHLVYVSTNPTDTTFIDSTYTSGLRYFYRAYILSAFGKLGGSNIESIQTSASSLLLNGNFEEEPIDNNKIPQWNVLSFFVDFFNLDSNFIFEGKYSLRAETDAQDTQTYDHRITQTIAGANFINGRTYKISLKMKSTEMTTLRAIIYAVDPSYTVISPTLQVSGETDWIEKSTIFSVPENVPVIYVELNLYSEMNSGIDGLGWFDDVKVELVP